jgi:hypothetical protein
MKETLWWKVEPMEQETHEQDISNNQPSQEQELGVGYVFVIIEPITPLF